MNNSTLKSVAHLSDVAASMRLDLVREFEPESILNNSRKHTLAGTIRPGIKVPYQKGSYVLTPKEIALYKQRMQERVPPNRIEKELKRSLQSKNVSYFSIYPSECANPDSADQIKALYGDKNGEIKRLKIVFVSDKWWEYLPHNLAAYKASGCFCRSELIDGNLIASRDPENGQTGPKRQLPCIPKECAFYMKKECKLSGILKFMILGIPGTGLWQLPTTSLIAINDIYSSLVALNNKLKNKGQSIIGLTFDLFKQQKLISRWDKNFGKRVKENHWLIRINCPDFPMADLIHDDASFKLNHTDTEKQASANSISGKTISRQEKKINPQASPVDHNNIEKFTSQTNGKKDTTQVISERIIPLLEPIGSVPISVVDHFISSVQKSKFLDLSIEEAKRLEQIVKAEEKAIKTQEHHKSTSKLPTMKTPTKKKFTEPVESLF